MRIFGPRTVAAQPWRFAPVKLELLGFAIDPKPHLQSLLVNRALAGYHVASGAFRSSRSYDIFVIKWLWDWCPPRMCASTVSCRPAAAKPHDAAEADLGLFGFPISARCLCVDARGGSSQPGGHDSHDLVRGAVFDEGANGARGENIRTEQLGRLYTVEARTWPSQVDQALCRRGFEGPYRAVGDSQA